MVPLIWGTYNPCIRFLYAEADPLDPASLTAVRTVLSAGALLLPALVGYLYREGRSAWRKMQKQKLAKQAASSGVGGSMTESTDLDESDTPLGAAMAAAADGAADGVSAAAVAVRPAAGMEAVEQSTASGSAGAASSAGALLSAPLNSARLGPVLTRTFGSVVLGGLELGFLNFLGTALQVEGLHSTSATRAGFLAEVTAVLTPLVSYMAGYEIPRQTWLAVAIGLVGSTMVAYDTSLGRQIQQSPPSAGTSSAPSATTSSPGLSQGAPTPAEGLLQQTSSAAGEAAAVSTAALADSATVAADAVTGTADALAASTAGATSSAVAAAVGAGGALDAVASTGDAAATSVAATASAVADAAASAVSTATTATPLEITGGEPYLLLACLFYSICTVRMGIYAPRMDTMGLAAMKKVGLSSMSVLWMAATNLKSGAALGSVFAFPDLSTRTPVGLAVLLYSGLGPGALATLLQVNGLSTVPATTAQVIFSMTPLCTAFFAYVILGGEATGPVAWAGGSLIIVAALMAANAQQQQYLQQQQQYQQQQQLQAQQGK